MHIYKLLLSCVAVTTAVAMPLRSQKPSAIGEDVGKFWQHFGEEMVHMGEMEGQQRASTHTQVFTDRPLATKKTQAVKDVGAYWAHIGEEMGRKWAAFVERRAMEAEEQARKELQAVRAEQVEAMKRAEYEQHRKQTAAEKMMAHERAAALRRHQMRLRKEYMQQQQQEQLEEIETRAQYAMYRAAAAVRHLVNDMTCIIKKMIHKFSALLVSAFNY
ncbi:hypothetical protein SARC_00628 [Sphaeroforma arctica JP610]|uniref:ATPase family AAA domain-containing protein n=1 Tax=Sphaeroforma arctica JP610 TaxID=667725 RepID=A0A0L0GDY8_9EUKA|nr:hypothetical protein SARC_00628 [Sphaeroforma arctica JP610]KNC87242.1 hypothetical protein SARC_00628 [Sphaeroforma arctica JP610]|eukprot:XP_014161144.1 hypothetical protein SARC_00628 [Sphaeroforma arctica JP610]